MKKLIIYGIATGALVLGTVNLSLGSSLIISGVIDGPLTGGTPKAVELYAPGLISDLSEYGLGFANNGGGTDFIEFAFPATSVAPGTFLYVAHEAENFLAFFDFVPDYTTPYANINGDDAVELFHNGMVVDVFGNITIDGSGQPWEYLDGWVYRSSYTGGALPAQFMIAEWYFSGPNVLDNEKDNITAAYPFPVGSFTHENDFQPIPTPEPASFTLFGTGLAYLVIRHKGRKVFYD